MNRVLIVFALFFGTLLLPTIARAAEPLVPDDDEESVVVEPPAASSAPLATAPPGESPPPRPQEKSTVRGLAGGGAGTGAVFGLQSTAVHLEAGLGVERKRLYIPFILSAELGRTPAGLGAGEVTLGVGFLGIATERLRLGGGVDAGYGWITRNSSSPLPHIGMYAFDAFALATFDLFSIGDRRAVYLGVKPSIGVRWGESIFALDHATVAWRGTAMIGMRF